ncbi:hypothetical protein OG21DRAFT_1489954 [Imleria badia]|nr:hypothetical protein OG21DRAFT_1489954 [Imleria badia]
MLGAMYKKIVALDPSVELRPPTLKPNQLHEVLVHSSLILHIHYVLYVMFVATTGPVSPLTQSTFASTMWLSNHFATPFTWSLLEVTAQSDSHSCGLLAANALIHHINPSVYPLLEPLLDNLDIA